MVVSLPRPPVALGYRDQLEGVVAMAPVDGQELWGGLKVRTTQAGVRVWAVLLRWPAAVAVGQARLHSREPVLDPFRVGGRGSRVEAEPPAGDVDPLLLELLKLNRARSVAGWLSRQRLLRGVFVTVVRPGLITR